MKAIRKTEQLQIRVSPQQKRLIQRQADRVGMAIRRPGSSERCSRLHRSRSRVWSPPSPCPIDLRMSSRSCSSSGPAERRRVRAGVSAPPQVEVDRYWQNYLAATVEHAAAAKQPSSRAGRGTWRRWRRRSSAPRYRACGSTCSSILRRRSPRETSSSMRASAPGSSDVTRPVEERHPPPLPCAQRRAAGRDVKGQLNLAGGAVMCLALDARPRLATSMPASSPRSRSSTPPQGSPPSMACATSG